MGKRAVASSQLASRRARIARVNAKRPAETIAVRIEFAEESDPDAEAAIDRWLRSLLLDSPATPRERRKP